MGHYLLKTGETLERRGEVPLEVKVVWEGGTTTEEENETVQHTQGNKERS